jgi:MraZ protein
MSRFRGRYDYSIDAKGRVNIPAKFRKMLSPKADETFVLGLAPDGCIRAHPLDIWYSYEDKLAALPETPESTRLRRTIYNSISDSTLDAQGRITLTPIQISKTNIEKNVTLIGYPGYIEIWSTDRFNSYEQQLQNFDNLYYSSVNLSTEQNEQRKSVPYSGTPGGEP